LRNRSAAKVFEDHLRLPGEHRFEEDLERNLSPEIMIFEPRGIFRGHTGARELVRLLDQELPKAPYVYTSRLVEGPGVSAVDGRSRECTCARRRRSFVIEDGWIVAQTIHYTVEHK
jgi:hypothetical protein